MAKIRGVKTGGFSPRSTSERWESDVISRFIYFGLDHSRVKQDIPSRRSGNFYGEAKLKVPGHRSRKKD